MKKHGFTLAEVLITLAIIGVVATITLPALMSNTQEQQAVTAFRKSMNTLNEVAQMNAAVDGFDYGGIHTRAVPGGAQVSVYNDNGSLTQSLWAMMASKAQVDQTRSGAANNVYGSAGNAGACARMNLIAFRDGTFLCYTDTVTDTNDTTVINAVVDTNGIKAPNRVSTCETAACLKNQKAINDQFEITLYRAMAMPGRVTVNENGTFADGGTAARNNAARWALSK